jgi:hypothetical protein
MDLKNIYILENSNGKTAVTSIKQAAKFLQVELDELKHQIEISRVIKKVRLKKEAFPIEYKGTKIERVNFAVSYSI